MQLWVQITGHLINKSIGSAVPLPYHASVRVLLGGRGVFLSAPWLLSYVLADCATEQSFIPLQTVNGERSVDSPFLSAQETSWELEIGGTIFLFLSSLHPSQPHTHTHTHARSVEVPSALFNGIYLCAICPLEGFKQPLWLTDNGHTEYL